jgi:hypothetical protein
LTFGVAIKKSIDDRYKKADAAVTDRVKGAKEDIEHGKTAATADVERAKENIQNDKATARDDLSHARQGISKDKAAATHDVDRAKNIQGDKAVATHALKRIENFQEDKASLKSAIHRDVNAGKTAFQKVLKQAEQSFHVNKNITFGPTSMTRNVTLFKQTINCPPLYPGLEIDLNPDIHVEGTIGIVVVGTIVPPHVSNFSSITSKRSRCLLTTELSMRNSRFVCERKCSCDHHCRHCCYAGHRPD